MDVDNIDIDLLLRRLESDYPQGYNYKVLREAASVIRFYRDEDAAETYRSINKGWLNEGAD